MYKFVSASCLLAVSVAQFVEPQTAKILKEQRFNAGDGRFGSAYAQEDGTVFREETSADGERVGQYSYIDNDGKTITVRYTAGKDGFRILEGAHVPTGATGLTAAPYKPPTVGASAPISFRQQPVQQVAQPLDYDYYEDTPAIQAPAVQTNPFINPHDPTHRNFQFNVNGAQFAPQQRFSQPQQSAVPACANCAGVNPFINPYDASHRNPQAFAQQPQQQRFVQPRQQQFSQQQFSQQTFAPATPAPKRNFFPPGQLQLNRFETGFNFDFTSQ